LQTRNYDIIVIWAWASGMMCIATLIEKWCTANILLLEKNDVLWKKVSITWWWRCNVTSWLTNNKEILSKYIRWADFLKFSVKNFSPSKLYKWFEWHWVPLKIEADMRVFPESNKSEDIINVFSEIFKESDKLEIAFWTNVLSVKKIDWLFIIETNKWNYSSNKLVITTWWQAYQKTWSTWRWYQFAKNLWHKITQLSPSLSSFKISEHYLKQIAWISLQNASILFEKNWISKRISWAMIFTHFGVSWPIIFTLSAHLAHYNISNDSQIPIFIQIDKNKDFKYRDKYLIEEIQKSPNKLIKTILSKQIPDRFIDAIQKQYDIDLAQKWSEFWKTIRKNLCHILSWKLSINLVWRITWNEFVTAWWVDYNEINPKTMESLLCKNLYFWGEIIDIDWETWWFNLHAAWSTGRSIAIDITKSENISR